MRRYQDFTLIWSESTHLFHEKLHGTSFEVQHVSDRPSNIFDFPNSFPSVELTLHRTSLGTTDIYCCSIQAISYFSRLGFSILKLIHAVHRLRKKPQAPCCCHLPWSVDRWVIMTEWCKSNSWLRMGANRWCSYRAKFCRTKKKVRTSYYHPKQGKELFSPPFDSSKYEKNQIVIWFRIEFMKNYWHIDTSKEFIHSCFCYFKGIHALMFLHHQHLEAEPEYI